MGELHVWLEIRVMLGKLYCISIGNKIVFLFVCLQSKSDDVGTSGKVKIWDGMR